MKKIIFIFIIIGLILIGSIYNFNFFVGRKVFVMVDKNQIAKQWVEIREDCTEDIIVFQLLGTNIPPARGRRRINFQIDGTTVTKNQGSNDQLVEKNGEWTLNGNELSINSAGWEGTYLIEKILQDKLTLKRK